MVKKVILITGGSDGVGKELARTLTDSHTVVIASRNADKLAAVAKEIGCGFEVCDIADYSQCEQAVTSVLKKHGRLDVLVNDAGLWIQGALDANDPAYIKQVMDVNATGTMLMTRAALPHMIGKSTRIINVVSDAGVTVKEERSVYNASKWAITGFTRALELELKSKKVSVCGIYPGSIQTEFFHKAGINKDLSSSLTTKDVVDAITYCINLPADVNVSDLVLHKTK